MQKEILGSLEDNDFFEFKISVKASDVFLAVAAYSDLATITDAPFHIGITEAGSLFSGTVKSSIGLGNLLWAGLGILLGFLCLQTLLKKSKRGMKF